jgi:hypothetical protein
MRRCGFGPAAAGAEEVRVEEGQAVCGHGGRVEGRCCSFGSHAVLRVLL